MLSGFPHPQIEKGMEDEHVAENLGCNVEFTTTNYGITTTPKQEYDIARNLQECPEEDKKDKKTNEIIRNVKKIKELEKLPTAVQANLILFEVLAIVSFFCEYVAPVLLLIFVLQVLYSGPMFQVSTCEPFHTNLLSITV